MRKDLTFGMIKPDVVGSRLDLIIEMIESGGFRILRIRHVQLTGNSATDFYSEHQGKFYFEELIAFMTSGKCLAMILQADDAVQKFRKLIGSTNPKNAEEDTIRKKFGTADGGPRNAIHGSDSNESAEREIRFIFPGELDHIPSTAPSMYAGC